MSGLSGEKEISKVESGLEFLISPLTSGGEPLHCHGNTLAGSVIWRTERFPDDKGCIRQEHPSALPSDLHWQTVPHDTGNVFFFGSCTQHQS